MTRVVLAGLLVGALVACSNATPPVGSSAGTSPEASAESSATAPSGAAGVTVTGVEYAYQGVPESAKAGTKVTFVNGGNVHARVKPSAAAPFGLPALLSPGSYGQVDLAPGGNGYVAMQNANVFPTMVIQMVSIGEETGALDGMLSKVADFFEAEVDDAVEALSSLMEPMIMVVLGTLIGGMVIAMYLPIFKMGQAV